MLPDDGDNAVDLTWMTTAAASLTLGMIHLYVWARQRERLDFLAFFVVAASAAVFGAFELQMMRAATPAAWAAALRAGHVPLAIFVVSTVVFVRLHFRNGCLDLLAAIVALRLATLVQNFTTGVNANFEQLVDLGYVVLWGKSIVAVPVGTPSRWAWLPKLGNLLLQVFVTDAALTLWRRGDRAALVGGSVVVSTTAAGGLAALSVYGLAQLPTFLLPAFVVILLAMSPELGGDVLRAAAQARELEASSLSDFRLAADRICYNHSC